MTQDALIQFADDSFKKCLEIMKAKNSDYSAGDDALRNFKTSLLVNLDPKAVLLANIVNKISRVGNLLNKPPAVTTEKIDDTILDLVNYSILLLAYLHDEKT